MPVELIEAVTALETAPAMTEVALSKLPVPAQGPQGPSQHDDDHAAPQLMLHQKQPMALPECTIPISKMKKHYSLPMQLRDMDPLKTEVMSFHTWATNPIQLDRDRAAISSRTWANISCSIMLFMGFLFYHVPVTEWVTLSLWLFTDATLFAALISFQLKKDNNIDCLTQQISHARKVLAFLEVKGTKQQAAAVQRQVQWLKRLNSQLVQALPRKRKDPDQLKEMNRWADAHVIVQTFDKYRQAVMEQLAQVQEQECRPWLAKALHDASLVCMLFGYLPPIRSGCLRGLQIPDTGSCLSPDCTAPTCLGNRLEYKGTELWLCLPHHKTQKKWDGAPIEVCLPAELAQLIQGYLSKGHSVYGGEQMQYMFGQGKQMSAATFSYYSQQAMKRAGLKQYIPVHTLRHIFIDERRGEDRVPGPQDAAAAQIMGNCEAQWDKTYDLKFNRREAKKAMKAMPTWRTAMLNKPVDAEEDTPVPLDTTDSESDIDVD